MTRLILSPSERGSTLWLRLVAEFESRLTRERARNDDGTLNEVETARLRGRISMLKELLALNHEELAAGDSSEDLS